MTFPGKPHEVVAVRDLSFSLGQGETLGIVGESGSGKTITLLSLLNLTPPQGKISARTKIEFMGNDILGTTDAALLRVRGAQIGMVFQNPSSALNPVLKIGDQISETVRAHESITGEEARERALIALDEVGLPDATRVYSSFPHTLSGGMQQRVMIAMAIISRPLLLIADEPTTSLDVTVQAQIIQLLRNLVDGSGMALILVSHDLGVINQVVDRTIVMYLGEAVEDSPTRELLENPTHPYTAGLIASVPTVGAEGPSRGIPGRQPVAQQRPDGCPFHPRCARRIDRCSVLKPEYLATSPGRRCACWLTQDLT